MANEITKRLVFDEVKSQALKEAGRAHLLAGKYTEQLLLRAKQLEEEVEKLSEHLDQVKMHAAKLRSEAHETQQQADDAYAETLKVVLTSFGLDMPVNAKLHYEDGVPISVEVLDSPPPPAGALD